MVPRLWELIEDPCSPSQREEDKYLAIILLIIIMDNRLNWKHNTKAVYKKGWADSTS